MLSLITYIDNGQLHLWKYSLNVLSYVYQSPSACEDGPISIKSSIVDIAYDYTKKKNVFRLTTYNGSEYLCQAEDNDAMLRWIHSIQANNNPDQDVSTVHVSTQQPNP